MKPLCSPAEIFGKRGSSDAYEEYFKSSLKATAVPPLKGALISALINQGVSRLVLGLTDSATPEVTLMFHNGDVKVKGEPKPGTQIEFAGVAIDFTRDPFMLTFDVPIGGIKGLEMEATRRNSKKSPPKK
jgi:hypothetical protein